MRAVRCLHKQVHVVDVPPPSGDGVLIRIAGAGICGSDLHLVDGPYELGVTLGHEMAGWLPDGRPVAIEPLAPCGHCEFCHDGAYNLCKRGPGMVMGVGMEGGMAEQIRVPERAIVPLASGIPVGDACLIEPLAVAYHGLRLADLRAGEQVLVVGAGAIGLCAAGIAVALGARVTVRARHDHQRRAAELLGARLEDQERGDYSLVIDAAGTTAALDEAVERCKPGGRILMLGSYWEPLAINGQGICMKELRLIPAAMYSRDKDQRDIDRAAALLAQHPRLAAAIITHRLPLEAAAEAFAIARNRASGAIKVVLEP